MQNDFWKMTAKGDQRKMESVGKSILNCGHRGDPCRPKDARRNILNSQHTPRYARPVHHLDLLNTMLVEYEDLFVEPTSLPPTRIYDHTINLKPNMEPINIRSYRCPPIQKNEIEKMVRDML